MRYKTIIHELLQDRYPALHERLRASRTLLLSLDRYAIALKARHDHWTTEFRQADPDRDPAQIASIALEMAIEDIQETLRCDSPPGAQDAEETFSLDAAMTHLLRHTPPA